MSAKIFRFVVHPRVHEYLQLGWVAHTGLDGTHHGKWAKLMEWPFDDRPPEEPQIQEAPIAS